MSFPARPPARRLVAVLAVSALALLGLVLAAPGTPSSAGTAEEATLLSLVNGARNAAGLPPLAASAALSEGARAHSAAMAAAGSLFHSGDLSGIVAEWTSVAENVAVAGSATEAHQALMGSAEHRANILGDFTLLGVGVVTGSDGRVWVTEHFAKTAATVAVEPAPAPEPEPVVEPAPAPEPVVMAAVEPAPAPAPAPAPKRRVTTTRVRTAGGTAATGAAAGGGDDVSCLPPPAQDTGRGHAYGRCEDGPASDQQRGR